MTETTPIALSDELLRLAGRLIWWKPPAEAARDIPRLAAQVMALGTWDDVQTARALLGPDAFRRVLDNPPPGVFDVRSWAYWHAVFEREPVPPLPKRQFPA